MTGLFDDLDDDDRRTTLALQQAFAGLTLDRPSPVTTPEQDDETARRLADAFGPLVLTAPAPGSTENADDATHDDQGRLVVLPGRRRSRLVRALGWPAAAAAACLVAAVAVLAPSGSSTAWAAEPRTPTTADRTGIAGACSAPLTRGPGVLEASGRAAPGGVTPSGDASGPAGPTPPRALPPLVALDVRGDLAYAVYQDRTWTVSCVVRSQDGGWRDQGVQVGPGSAATSPGLVSGGATTLPDGGRVSTVSGSVAPGTARVTFRLDDGTQVEASVLGSTWSAWFPGDAALDVASLRAVDAAGRAVPLPTR